MLEGLDCANCAAKIEDKLGRDQAIASVTLNFLAKELEVVFREKTSSEEALKQVSKIVHTYEPYTRVHLSGDHEARENLVPWRDLIPLMAGTGLFAAAFFVPRGQVLLLLAAYGLVGYDILHTAFKNIIKGEVFDENFLMVIATFAAFYLGETFEAVGVFIFYKIGEVLEEVAIEKSTRRIKRRGQEQRTTTLLMNPFSLEFETAETEHIKPGDTILVRPGEMVPLDGELLETGGALDAAALTGESYPLEKTRGEEVLAGEIVLEKPLKIKVTRVLSESAYQKIQDLLKKATLSHSPTEKMITRFARIYTPVVVITAFAIVLIPWLLSMGNLQSLIYVAAIFLVVSCPCALVVSIPLVYYVALGKAAGEGIIIKGSKYLDRLREVDHFVYDKTGTLTEGRFRVKAVEGDPDTLYLGALGELYSTHPIGISIREAYQGELPGEKARDHLETSGFGITYLYEGERVLVGNRRLMARHGIGVFGESDVPGLYVARGEKLLGRIFLEDTIKPSAFTLIENLKGVTHHILSGDTSERVREVATALKIKNYQGELMPEDKLKALEGLMAGGRVAFVGDGINDGPVLARSDVGIAMGLRGSDLAVEQSRIVILEDNLDKIPRMVALSKRVRTLVAQNIVLALGIKIGVMILALLGYSSMALAIFADVGVALLAILNAMRISY